MKRKSFIFAAIFLFCITAKAQLVVASPGTDAEIQAQTLLMTQLAFNEQLKEYQYYVEYISQFVEIIASVRNTTTTIKNISKIGKTLKEKSEKEWLNEVENELSEVMPEFSQIKEDLSGKIGSGRNLMNGAYSEYVSKWDNPSKNYHEQLIRNYQNNVMFPELYPAASKIGAEFEKKENAQKIIHKAWIESGMEYELKDDIIRKNTFKKYYNEYIRQAKSNDNIEAMGLANILQAEYLTVETLEHLRKNSDVRSMKDEFEKDAQNAYLEMKAKLNKESERLNKPTEENGIFSLSKKKKK